MLGVHSGGSAPGSCCSVSSLYLTLTKKNTGEPETKRTFLKIKFLKGFHGFFSKFNLPETHTKKSKNLTTIFT
jgi:hypothetical protein